MKDYRFLNKNYVLCHLFFQKNFSGSNMEDLQEALRPILQL